MSQLPPPSTNKLSKDLSETTELKPTPMPRSTQTSFFKGEVVYLTETALLEKMDKALEVLKKMVDDDHLPTTTRQNLDVAAKGLEEKKHSKQLRAKDSLKFT